jgi:molybdopterin converting factor small subunit
MKVRIRLFASMREAVGKGEIEVDLPPPATAESAWQRLVETTPALGERRRGLLASINRRYAPFDSPLAEGDELVFIPPVSGGSS